MNIDEIMSTIKMLGDSQGFYSRLYYNLRFIQESNPDQWDELAATLESHHFKDAVDLILYLEG